MWLLEGFANALSPLNLAVAILACGVGTLVGVLPGLGPTSAVALLFPISLWLPPDTGLIALGAIFYGAMYGGSTTSILLNIPGEISSVPACLEGFPLTQKGRAGPALVMCAVVSFIGGMMALGGLAFFAPFLAEVALAFGPYEYFALMIFSLTCVAGLSGRSVRRGMALAAFGLFICLVGPEPGTELFRLTYGSQILLQGFDVVPAVIGLFGIGEVLLSIGEETKTIVKGEIGKLMPNRQEWALGLKSGLRGSVLGSVLGLLPGVLPSVASFISYSAERKVAKERAKIGTGAGSMEGICGPEAANNAAAVSGFIPLMALGIPTGPVLAIVLAALIIYGVVPGPLMFTTHKVLAATVIASFLIGNVILVILNIPLVGLWVRLTLIPYRILAPLILAICFWGAYCIRNAVYDIWVAVIFGVLGYFMKRHKLPAAPLVLGFILGDPVEMYFRQVAALGPLHYLFTRPISLSLFICAVVVVVLFTVIREKQSNLEIEEE